MSSRLLKQGRPKKAGRSGSKTLLRQQEGKPTGRNGGVPGKLSPSCTRLSAINRPPEMADKSDSTSWKPEPSNFSVTYSNSPEEQRKSNVTYNLYINVSDDNCKGLDSGYMKGSYWPGSGSSGLAKACSVFCNIKSGRIHVSKLRPALHILEVLVTSEEMHQTLKSVNVDASGNLNFAEFLEAVNRTSPFAEIEAFQNTLRAFRRIKTGTLAANDLRSVLTDLEIYLCPEELQQALDRTRLDKNKKVDFSEFILAARDLQIGRDKDLEAECSFMQRNPFQDVAGLINVDRRWRKNYQSYFDEDASSTASLFPILALTSSDENITQPQKSPSRKLSNGTTEVKRSQSDTSRKSNTDVSKENQDITDSPLDVIEEKHETENVVEVQKSQSKVIPSSQDN